MESVVVGPDGRDALGLEKRQEILTGSLGHEHGRSWLRIGENADGTRWPAGTDDYSPVNRVVNPTCVLRTCSVMLDEVFGPFRCVQ